MKIVLQISKVLNILALCCLLLGPYGLILTGALQILAALLYLISNPKSHRIYIYLLITALFLLFWKMDIFGWQFLIPISLMIYLTFIIHTKKKNLQFQETH